MGNSTGKKKPEKQRDLAPQADISTNNDFSIYESVGHQTQQSPLSASLSPQEKKVVHPPLPRVPQRNEPSSPKGDVRLFVALFDYDARTSEDLTFKKGDYLEVRPENTAFDRWQAKSRSSQHEGCIPSNYVAEVKTLEAEE